MKGTLGPVGVAFATCALVVATAGAPLAVNTCAGSKIKSTGKKAKCKLGVYARVPLDTAKLTGCEAKLSQSFTKAEAKATKEPCSTTGDANAIEDKVDAFVNDVVTEVDVFPDPSRCQSAKLKAAGKKVACRLKLVAGLARHGTPIDPGKDGTCKSKFSSASVKAEAQGDCGAAASDTGAIEAKVDAFVTDVTTEIPGDIPSTTTTTTTLPCGVQGPVCGGSCPDGGACEAVVTGPGTFECACAGPVPCSLSCGGDCPEGSQCQSFFTQYDFECEIGGCACVATTYGCSDACLDYGFAGCTSGFGSSFPGACPAGQTCVAILYPGCPPCCGCNAFPGSAECPPCV